MKNKLHDTADAAKERYPPAATTVDYVMDKINFLSDFAFSTLSKYYHGCTYVTVFILSFVTGLKRKASEKVRMVKNKTFDNINFLKNVIQASKQKSVSIASSVLVSASKLTEETSVHFSTYLTHALSGAQPYVIIVAQIMRPFMYFTVTFTTQWVEKLRPIADPFISSLLKVI